MVARQRHRLHAHRMVAGAVLFHRGAADRGRSARDLLPTARQGSGVSAPPAPRGIRSFRWYHGLLAVALGLIAVMWIYALGFAPKGNPNRLHDTAWTANAESVCAAAQRQIAALPPAKTAKSAQERADVVDQANVVVADMIATLRTAEVSGTVKEQHYV